MRGALVLKFTLDAVELLMSDITLPHAIEPAVSFISGSTSISYRGPTPSLITPHRLTWRICHNHGHSDSHFQPLHASPSGRPKMALSEKAPETQAALRCSTSKYMVPPNDWGFPARRCLI
jgi:hypothetical protein